MKMCVTDSMQVHVAYEACVTCGTPGRWAAAATAGTPALSATTMETCSTDAGKFDTRASSWYMTSDLVMRQVIPSVLSAASKWSRQSKFVAFRAVASVRQCAN